jgi:hypothetical protein
MGHHAHEDKDAEQLYSEVTFSVQRSFGMDGSKPVCKIVSLGLQNSERLFYQLFYRNAAGIVHLFQSSFGGAPVNTQVHQCN